MEKSNEYILFEQRLENAFKQVTDLTMDSVIGDAESVFGMTTEELWGTAKFQFSEAVCVARELIGEEKETADKAIAGFREMFKSEMHHLE